jgi:hypothetical protein
MTKWVVPVVGLAVVMAACSGSPAGPGGVAAWVPGKVDSSHVTALPGLVAVDGAGRMGLTSAGGTRVFRHTDANGVVSEFRVVVPAGSGPPIRLENWVNGVKRQQVVMVWAKRTTSGAPSALAVSPYAWGTVSVTGRDYRDGTLAYAVHRVARFFVPKPVAAQSPGYLAECAVEWSAYFAANVAVAAAIAAAVGVPVVAPAAVAAVAAASAAAYAAEIAVMRCIAEKGGGVAGGGSGLVPPSGGGGTGCEIAAASAMCSYPLWGL